uniref:RING-type domain-containing protein n=1 Tax=Ditylenchus dipsaci TaxID=166011 RepID=A0A915E7B0_9BILA
MSHVDHYYHQHHPPIGFQEVPQTFSHPPGFSPNTAGSRSNNLAGASASRPRNPLANPRHRHKKGPSDGSGPSQSSNYSNRSQKVANGSAFGAPPPGFEPSSVATVNMPDISSSSGSRPVAAHTEAAPPKRSPNRTAGPPQSQNNETNRREHGREGGPRQKRFDRDGGGNHPIHNIANNSYNSTNSYPRGAGGGYRPRNARNRIDHAGVRMTGSTKNCLICCQPSDLFGIGSCLHPMCMECAIRVRILGESQACPQCRMQIDTLYFVQSPPFSGEFKVPKETVSFNDAQNYGVKFETEYALECFKSYMSHKCSICCSRGEEMSFANFSGLHQHMSNVHQLSFCYLCSENVNVLTKDRKTYTKNNLLKHMNGEGDQLEDGFHGHPKCLFCDQRFYDDEGQYKHLRKDHYFCQICDADGANNVFYKNHYELTRHYKRTHIPCDNRDCEAMGIVFRTQMELNVHKAKQHSGQTTGERHIQLDFQYTRNSATTSRGQSTGQQQDQHMQFMPAAPENMTIVPSAQSGRHPVRIIRSAYNTQSSADFPTLETNIAPYGAPPNWRSSTTSQSARAPKSQATQVPLQSGEQFPSLSGGPSANPGPSETAKQQSVWAKGNTKELFNEAATARAAQAAERAKRRPVIPMPDIWPEVPMTEVVSESKKNKKKKSKTVPINTVTAKATGDFVPSSSKFELLSVFDEASEMGSGNNWWNKPSATKKTVTSREESQNIPILKPTSDDFVSIEMPGNSDGGPDSKPMTLRSIAMGIDHSKVEKEEIQTSSKHEITQETQNTAKELVSKESEEHGPSSTGRSFAEKLLSELFVFPKKNELDVLQLVNTQFNSLIKSPSVNCPLRAMHSVVVKTDGSVVVSYNEDGNIERTFVSVKEVFQMKDQQNFHLRHIFISVKDAEMHQVYMNFLNLINPYCAQLGKFFTAWHPMDQLPKNLAEKHSLEAGFYGRQFGHHVFCSHTIDLEWPAHGDDLIDQPSACEMIKWLEFDHPEPVPKRFRANCYGFKEEPMIFMNKLFARFHHQNCSCPFEIIVIDLNEGMDLSDLPINKSVKNYTTNEVLESILMPANNVKEDNPDYKKVQWVIRRRHMHCKWNPWWSTETGKEEEDEDKFGVWYKLTSTNNQSLMRRVRYKSN